MQGILLFLAAFCAVESYQLVTKCYRCNRMVAPYSVYNKLDYRLHMTKSDETDESTDDSSDVNEVEDIVDEVATSIAENDTTINTTVVLTPLEAAIKKKENDLLLKVTELENILRSERLLLAKTKDKISESGKNGYFIIQAQIANYLKNKEIELKENVAVNKKEFVMKMLPVVDSFLDAPHVAPASTEREEKMHESFGSLLKGILNVFNKYGYQEFTVENGSKFDNNLHSAEKVEVNNEVDEGTVLMSARSGFKDAEGNVVRKAAVTVSKKEN